MFFLKRVKTLKQWGVFQNNAKEVAEYGFSVSVLHPDNMEYRYMCTPADSDMEFNDVDDAVSWIQNY